MNRERTDIADALDPARFARRNPALDQALRAQLKPPVMDAAFRAQVRARIAAAKAAPVMPATHQASRAALWLQIANVTAAGITAALVFAAVGPRLGGALDLTALTSLTALFGGNAGIVIGGVATLASLAYALRQLRPGRFSL